MATESNAIQDIVLGVQKAAKKVQPKSLIQGLDFDQFNESRSRIRDLIDNDSGSIY